MSLPTKGSLTLLSPNLALFFSVTYTFSAIRPYMSKTLRSSQKQVGQRVILIRFWPHCFLRIGWNSWQAQEKLCPRKFSTLVEQVATVGNMTLRTSHSDICGDMLIGHSNVQSCLLIDFKCKPISLQYSWLSVEQPIRVDWVLYMHHWQFQINKKTIPMLTLFISVFCRRYMVD